MTREEAIEELERLLRHWDDLENGKRCFWGYDNEAVALALSALRPVSREQVWRRGEWHSHYKSGIHAGNGVVCSECDMWNNRAAHFCPSCGAPMTDEAVQMVMERWKEAAEHEVKAD